MKILAFVTMLALAPAFAHAGPRFDGLCAIISAQSPQDMVQVPVRLAEGESQELLRLGEEAFTVSLRPAAGHRGASALVLRVLNLSTGKQRLAQAVFVRRAPLQLDLVAGVDVPTFSCRSKVR